jgi:hypothetical protein
VNPTEPNSQRFTPKPHSRYTKNKCHFQNPQHIRSAAQNPTKSNRWKTRARLPDSPGGRSHSSSASNGAGVVRGARREREQGFLVLNVPGTQRETPPRQTSSMCTSHPLRGSREPRLLPEVVEAVSTLPSHVQLMRTAALPSLACFPRALPSLIAASRSCPLRQQ